MPMPRTITALAAPASMSAAAAARRRSYLPKATPTASPGHWLRPNLNRRRGPPGSSTTMIEQLADDVRMVATPARAAHLYVLGSRTLPSVLLEMGFMSNRRDEALLRQPAHRRVLVQAIRDAIDDYFAAIRAPASRTLTQFPCLRNIADDGAAETGSAAGTGRDGRHMPARPSRGYRKLLVRPR